MALRRQVRGNWWRHARARNAGLGMAPTILAPDTLASDGAFRALEHASTSR